MTKKPYYFSPRENITKAQAIPLCTAETIDTSTLTLKGDTKMCYGKNGTDMVIITKKLSGFYGATNSITTPKFQPDLDADFVETIEEYNERLRQEAQERVYLRLLKILYLPAI